MKKIYTVQENDQGLVISYEQDGYLISFTDNLGNSYYREYLASLEATESLEEGE